MPYREALWLALATIRGAKLRSFFTLLGIIVSVGFLVVVVSNQSGVGRGYYTEEDVDILHRHIAGELAKSGARVDAWFYCPHHPQGKGSYSLACRCRKPLPGMLLEAARRYAIDLEASVMIGDKLVDMEAGAAAGCRTILVRTGYGSAQEPDVSPGTAVYDDLLAAARALAQPHDGFDSRRPGV